MRDPFETFSKIIIYGALYGFLAVMLMVATGGCFGLFS